MAQVVDSIFLGISRKWTLSLFFPFLAAHGETPFCQINVLDYTLGSGGQKGAHLSF